MAEHEVGAGIGKWAAGVGAAVSATMIGALVKMRDLGRDHTVQIEQLDEWRKITDEKLDATHTIAVATREEVNHVHEAVHRIETKLDGTGGG